MIKYFFLFFTVLFLSSTLHAQIISEDLSAFEYDVKDLLLNTNKNTIRKIDIKLNSKSPDEIYHHKDFKLSFIFLNDSVIVQKMYRSKYTLLIKGRQIVEIEKRTYKPIVEPNSCVKDSAGYKIITRKSIHQEDTIFYFTIQKLDSAGRIEESTTINTKNEIHIIKNQSDAISIQQYYMLVADSMLLTNEFFHYRLHFQKKYGYYTKDSFTHLECNYPQLSVNKLYDYITCSNLTFDYLDRLIEINKFSYYNAEKDWSTRDTMFIDYKERKRIKK